MTYEELWAKKWADRIYNRFASRRGHVRNIHDALLSAWKMGREQSAREASLGRMVLGRVYELKKASDPLQAVNGYVSFDADEEYDVAITFMLRPKKSQLQIGMEMFNGDPEN